MSSSEKKQRALVPRTPKWEWSVYGPILAEVCKHWGDDLVDLVCRFVYPEPLPEAVLKDLEHATRQIYTQLVFRSCWHDNSWIRQLTTYAASQMGHMRTQRLKYQTRRVFTALPGDKWHISIEGIWIGPESPAWAHKEKGQSCGFWSSQSRQSYLLSFAEERKRRRAVYEQWKLKLDPNESDV